MNINKLEKFLIERKPDELQKLLSIFNEKTLRQLTHPVITQVLENMKSNKSQQFERKYSKEEEENILEIKSDRGIFVEWLAFNGFLKSDSKQKKLLENHDFFLKLSQFEDQALERLIGLINFNIVFFEEGWSSLYTDSCKTAWSCISILMNNPACAIKILDYLLFSALKYLLEYRVANATKNKKINKKWIDFLDFYSNTNFPLIIYPKETISNKDSLKLDSANKLEDKMFRIFDFIQSLLSKDEFIIFFQEGWYNPCEGISFEVHRIYHMRYIIYI